MSRSDYYIPPLKRAHILRTTNRLKPDDAAWGERFADAVLAGASKQRALIWMGEAPQDAPKPPIELPEWVRLADQTTLQNTEQYEAGAWYPLDLSSCCTASVMTAVAIPHPRILDVCASPGGKSIFAARALQPSQLVCNEVIGKRHGPLKSNLRRCGIEAEVVQHDPGILASRHAEQFDLVIIDAPCSGQSLPAKGEAAPGAYQDHVVNGNMQRQRRILAEAAKTVAPGGYLAYLTCTFAREENEKQVSWLLGKRPDFVSVPVPHLAVFQSWLTEEHCYRFSPMDSVGAGGFATLLKRL